MYYEMSLFLVKSKFGKNSVYEKDRVTSQSNLPNSRWRKSCILASF